MAYCTEDTPYNKSTATSLSDLSVIDDDAVFAIKSGLLRRGEFWLRGLSNLTHTLQDLTQEWENP